ncbi:hypothetical protein C0J52_14337 [Blattella germanica]|nr:hypothetical protein C0J52_14337 [Blattella germanica]
MRQLNNETTHLLSRSRMVGGWYWNVVDLDPSREATIIWNIITVLFSKGNLVNQERIPNILDCVIATCEKYIKNSKSLVRTKDEKVVTLMSELIPALQMASKWKILLPPFIHEFNILKQDNFSIIIINSARDLIAIEINIDNMLKSLSNGNSVNFKASFLIIVTDNADEDTITLIIAVFYCSELFDVIVMLEDEQGLVRLFRGEKHSRKCKTVKKIEVINTCVRDESGVMFTSNSQLRKEIGFTEFQGCHILLDYGHYPPLTIKSENHLSREMNIKETGISLILLDLVFQQMKISYGILENKPISNKLFSYARLNTQIYLSFLNSILSYYPFTNYWFVQVAEVHPRWSKSLEYNRLSSCFLNTWGIILNVGVKLPRTTKLRCVFLSWIMFALAIHTVYQTFVTSFMVDPGRLHQVNSYDELINSKYNLIVPIEEVIYTMYGEKLPQNLKLLNNAKDALLFALANPETAIFLNEELLINIWIVPRVSELLNRLDESGISKKIAYDIIDPMGLQRWALRRTNLEEEYVTMSLLHLQSVFIFMFFLHGISLTIFVCEIIIFSSWRMGVNYKSKYF